MSNSHFIPVLQALETILSAIEPLPPETVRLEQALGRILAAPVTAQDSLPPFTNSSMDGYALIGADSAGATPDSPVSLRVIGEVAAGALFEGHVTAGTAVRIMTGAPLPDGADAVIRVEDTDEAYGAAERPLPDVVNVTQAVKAGNSIRHAGEDLKSGETIMQPGHRIRPQEIGVLASLGASTVEVIRRPRVAILATGDELIPVEEPLRPGKIRNSNGYTQAAQITALGAEPIILGVARDTEEDVRAKLQQGLDQGVDLFISSAGVSVGVYDVVTAVLQQRGDVNFWKVRMRPGKPLAFGTYNDIPYLGLPGNPVSAMVSFERFARPAILKLAGHTKLERPTVPVIIAEDFDSDGRETYVRAIVTRHPDGRYAARMTGDQGSHIMTSLVKANALVVMPEGERFIPAGTELQALMIDWPNEVF